jgi:hypothetical protein
MHFTYIWNPDPNVYTSFSSSAGDRLRPHHVAPDSYQVTWWPGSKPEDEINSQYTSDDHLLISGLKPAITYTVIVEARKLQKYSALQEGKLLR